MELASRHLSALAVLLQAAAVAGQGPATGAQEIVFEHSGPTVVDRAILIPRARFTPRALHELGREFTVGQEPKKLARLTIGTTREAVARAHFNPSVHPTYESSVNAIHELDLPELPIARVLVMNGAASLSYRDDHGYWEQTILGSVNPAELLEGQSHFQLLHFFLNKPGPALAPSEYSLTIFLRASPEISISGCIAVTRKLRDLTGVPTVQTEVRTEPFFPRTLHFPAILPFQPDLKLPSKFAFEASPHVSCVTDPKRGVRCNGHGFRP